MEMSDLVQRHMYWKQLCMWTKDMSDVHFEHTLFMLASAERAVSACETTMSELWEHDGVAPFGNEENTSLAAVFVDAWRRMSTAGAPDLVRLWLVYVGDALVKSEPKDTTPQAAFPWYCIERLGPMIEFLHTLTCRFPGGEGLSYVCQPHPSLYTARIAEEALDLFLVWSLLIWGGTSRSPNVAAFRRLPTLDVIETRMRSLRGMWLTRPAFRVVPTAEDSSKKRETPDLKEAPPAKRPCRHS